MKYDQVSIIGIGLIGGSIGLDLLNKGFAKNVVGWGRNPDHLRAAVEKGSCLSATTSMKEALEGAEIVVLCTPVEVIVEQLYEIESLIEDRTLVMDVGSVKKIIVNSAEKANLIGTGKKEFVGVHPMAGSEKTGAGNAREGLFKGSPCIITPHEKNTRKAIDITVKFWENLGAEVVKMTPEVHDLTVGFVSHLPHIVSSVLSKVCGSSLESPQIISRTAGASFTELTRIAGSSPQLWTQIYLQNKKQVLKAVDGFIDSLNQFRDILQNEDREKIEHFIREGVRYREESQKKENKK